MATLTNTKIKDTYDGLLKTTDNDVIGITEKVITDGLGNASILSIGTQSASFSNNVVITGSLTASGLSYPTSDGTAGQAIVTDAAGNLSFATVTSPTPTLQQVTTAGATTTDSITVGGLTASSLIYPSTDGTSGQVISTDGAGNLTFTTVSTSTPSLDQVTAVGATSSVNVTINGADLGTIVNSSNTFFGDSALALFTTGSSNTVIGYQALTAATSGSNNTVIGARALDNYTSGTTNTAIGSEALGNGTTLSYNVAIGDDALFYINGSYNVALGHNAGEIRLGGGTKSAGDRNIYIGSDTVSAASDTDNEIVIGANAVGNGSNSATYGDSNITKHIFTGGNVGIGTQNPQTGMHISLDTPIIRLENIDTSLIIDQELAGIEMYSNDASGLGVGIKTSIRAVSESSTGSKFGLKFSTTDSTGSNDVERMRIDSSGNVGIGSVAIGTFPNTILDVASEAPTLTLRDSRTGGTWTAGTQLGKLDFYTSDATGIGAHSIASIGVVSGGASSASPDGELVFSTGAYNTVASERMRIDSSGNVGINCSPASGVKLQVNGDGSIFRLDGTANTSRGMLLRNVGTATAEIKTDGNLDFNIEDAGRTMRFLNGNTERMRITSGGYLKVGRVATESRHLINNSANGNSILDLEHDTSLSSQPYGVNVDFRNVSPDNNSNWFHRGEDSTAVRFYIYSDGDVWTSDAGTLTSDETLKNNITDATPKLDDVMNLRVRNYYWNEDYHPKKTDKKLIGFVAQEFEQVFPHLVSEHKIKDEELAEDGTVIQEAVYKKGIKEGKLIPILVKAMQEQQDIINDLKARIETLEAK